MYPEGTEEEIAAIEARALAATEDRYAEVTRVDVPRLIATLRDRDATIASYRVAHETTLRHATEANATIAELRAEVEEWGDHADRVVKANDRLYPRARDAEAALERALSDLAAMKEERDMWHECARGTRCSTCKATDRQANGFCSNGWHLGEKR